jgi:glutaredoxin
MRPATGITELPGRWRYNVRMGRFLKFAAIALGLYLGWQQFANREEEQESLVGQTANIEIYTTSQCGYCKQAKAYMDERGIEYLEKNVETDMELRKELRARGGRGVPYFFVYGEPMRGFDPARLEKLRSQGS